jgi:hypothetical protein
VLALLAHREGREARELEIWDAARNVQEAFRADSNLGGLAVDMRIGEARALYTEVPNQMGGSSLPYRVLEFDLSLAETEAEEIVA